MDVRAAYTDEEWKQVKDLPALATLLIASSGSSGPMQVVMESGAAAKEIAAARSNPDPLVTAIVADLTDRDDTDKPTTPADAKSRETMRAATVAEASAVAALVAAKTPDSSTAYADWVLAIAHRVAAAAKEHSVLGIGGVRVSPEEEESLAALAAALGR